MTPTQITKVFDCTKSNLTQRLNLLEKNGLVRRVRPSTKADGRTVRIAITDAGKSKIDEAIQLLRKHGALLEKHFSDEEKKACHDFLKKVNQIIDPHEHIRPCPHR
jgi:DNA-binding MarR family transcriptional regulator